MSDWSRDNVKDRLGSFKISRTALREDWDAMQLLLRSVVVLDCRANFAYDEVGYLALSPLFKIIKHGYGAPEYEIVHTKENDGTFSPCFEEKKK